MLMFLVVASPFARERAPWSCVDAPESPPKPIPAVDPAALAAVSYGGGSNDEPGPKPGGAKSTEKEKREKGRAESLKAAKQTAAAAASVASAIIEVAKAAEMREYQDTLEDMIELTDEGEEKEKLKSNLLKFKKQRLGELNLKFAFGLYNEK